MMLLLSNLGAINQVKIWKSVYLLKLKTRCALKYLVLGIYMRFLYKIFGSAVILDLFEDRQTEIMIYLSKVPTS